MSSISRSAPAVAAGRSPSTMRVTGRTLAAPSWLPPQTTCNGVAIRRCMRRWPVSHVTLPPIRFGFIGTRTLRPSSWQGESVSRWLGSTTKTIAGTGNSYAALHISGIAALIRSKHPDLRPFQIKTVLWATSVNVCEASGPDTAGKLSRRMRTAPLPLSGRKQPGAGSP